MKKPLLFLCAGLFILSVFLSCSDKGNPSVLPQENISTNTPVITPTITPVNTPDATATAAENRTFVYVDGGTFTQGNWSYTFVHTISPYYIGKYEVTYDLWWDVRQWALSNGYTFENAGREGNDGIDGAAPTDAVYKPVTMINWRDAIVWCNAYSQMSGLPPFYCSDAGLTTPVKDSTSGINDPLINLTPGSHDQPYVNWEANGYRLPTEGEWEFAAKYVDGLSWTPYNYASGATAVYGIPEATMLVAWYDKNSGNFVHEVGGKKQNALGIHDMSGNVSEWCWDAYTTYPAGAYVNFRGAEYSTEHINRGGHFSGADGLQVGVRTLACTGCEYDCVGFRLARTQF